MKACSKCGELLSLENFCRNPNGAFGRYSICKKCSSKSHAGFYKSHRQKILQRGVHYNETPGGRKSQHVRAARHKFRHPEKIQARTAATHAVEVGLLIKEPCSECGDPKSEAHHDDYSKALEVRWLCRKHHREFHRAHPL